MNGSHIPRRSKSREVHTCCANLTSGWPTAKPYLCGKHAKVESGGQWYCGVHSPERVAAARAALTARHNARREARRKVDQLNAAAGELLEALEIATGTLETFVTSGAAHPDSVIGKNVVRGRAAIAKAKGVTPEELGELG